MKSKPLIFSGPMVRAILEGRKTMTRRTKDPKLKKGDQIWVKETWGVIDNREYTGNEKYIYVEYKADSGNPYPGEWPPEEAKGNPDAPKWKSPLFMFKKYSRITFEVLDVRVERVQDISEEDAYAEGMKSSYGACYPPCSMPDPTFRNGFADYWDSLYKKKPEIQWEQNPWVWVISLERITSGSGVAAGG